MSHPAPFMLKLTLFLVATPLSARTEKKKRKNMPTFFLLLLFKPSTSSPGTGPIAGP